MTAGPPSRSASWPGSSTSRPTPCPEALRYGLEARASFDPPGTFSNACHAALVAIDPGTGAIRLHRYLVVEDCGVVINPLIVDGQVRGGVTQGVAAALLERIRYDDEGQPASATLMDYLPPTAAEMCPVDIVHLQTPSRFSAHRREGDGRGRHDRRPGGRAQRDQRRALRHSPRSSTTSRCCRRT